MVYGDLQTDAIFWMNHELFIIKIIITRRILDILYSAQHGNQHKDAFA